MDRDLTTEAIVLAHLVVKNQHLKGPQFVDKLVNGIRGRSLLTYAAEKGDCAAELTRLLLNSGSKIWPEDDRREDVAIRVEKEVEGSAFTWFLRALLARRGVDHEGALRHWGDETLYLLGHAAVSLPNCGPDALRDHLQRVVLRLGRSEKCEGPVFAEIRRRLAPLGAQPLSLKFLCLSKIRGAVGPGNLIRNKLDIPNTMLNYLQLG